MLNLMQRWEETPAPGGGFVFTLRNDGAHAMVICALSYASMTRPGRFGVRQATVEGARIAAQFGNHVRLEPDTPRTLAPGACWEIAVRNLSHAPQNRTQGAMAAWVDTPEGRVAVTVADLAPPSRSAATTAPPAATGQARLPLAMLPWPAQVAVPQWGAAPLLTPARSMDLAAFARIAALHRRLFETAPEIMRADPSAQGGRPVAAQDVPMEHGAYRLDFTPDAVTVIHGDQDGLRHGLIALAQIAHGAQRPDWAFPVTGQISDGPRFGWRGAHLDVARNFRPFADVMRFADILAWLRMNRLHLHLTDDEGWRLESPTFPALTEIGARRGPDERLPAQYADGMAGQAGYYTQHEMRALIAHAAQLGIGIMPELDLPGHCAALLAALPDLRDPQEPADSYRSIQGYPNNAINPGLQRSYEVAEALIDEWTALFPFEVLHLGGDEVDARAWACSPAAQKLGLADAPQLQAHFMTRLQKMVQKRGRILGGWDECADGGGVKRKDALLFAWRETAKTAELIAAGYDVVATPGQAYYCDMITAPGWQAFGTSWAGAVAPEDCYRFEPSQGLPDGPGRLLGVQAGIWSEHLRTLRQWNAMVFPRLSAIAETGWTVEKAKNWPCFAARAGLIPTL